MHHLKLTGLLSLALLATACGGGTSTTTPTPTPTPGTGSGSSGGTTTPSSFTLALSSAYSALTAGQSSNTTVSLTGTTSGAAKLTATPEFAYPGLSVTVPTSSLTSSTNGTVNLAAGSSALPGGPYRINVSATDGTSTASSTLYTKVGSSGGLERLNAIRAASGLNPVTEDLDRGADCWYHARYEALNGAVSDSEEPNSPYYTTKGNKCLPSSILLNGAVIGLGITESNMVDSLISAPFHASALLDPSLTKSALAIYSNSLPTSDNPLNGYISEVISSKIDNVNPINAPIFFPGNNSTINITTFTGGESPDSLAPCGFSAPTGLPLFVMTGRGIATTVSNASLFENGLSIPLCGYGLTQFNTGTSEDRQAQELLAAQGAAYLIPSRPLKSGSSYAVSVTVNGAAYHWTFKEQ